MALAKKPKSATAKSKPKAKPAKKPVAAAKKVTKAAKPKPTRSVPAKPKAKAKPQPKPTPKPTRAAKTAKPEPAVKKKAATKPPKPAVGKKSAHRTPAPVAPPKAPEKVVVVKSAPVVPPKPAAKAPTAPTKTAVKTSSPAIAPVAKLPPAKPGVSIKPRSGEFLTEDQIRLAPDSDYMNDHQLAFFRERLLQMRNEVLARELDVKERLHQREVFADPADRASAEEEHWLDLRLRERESLLLRKIDDALRRIRDREYGYCEKTGEQIGIARLLARPTATVCVDIKGQDERAESQYRDR